MAWRITTPNKNYCGVTEGVAFVNGEAVVDSEVLKNVLVQNYGYHAEELKDKGTAKKDETAKKDDKKK